MKYRHHLAGLSAAILLTGNAMARNAPFDPAREIAFVCTAVGAEKLRPAATAAQVCAVFKRRIDAAIDRQTQISPAWPARGNAIRVTVRIVGPAEIGAAATIRNRGRVSRVPELTQDVMDKRAGMRDLELLAAQMSRMIVQ